MNFDNYIAEEFDDIRILRYRVDVFETLPLQEKLFVYYLSRGGFGRAGYSMGSEQQI